MTGADRAALTTTELLIGVVGALSPQGSNAFEGLYGPVAATIDF